LIVPKIAGVNHQDAVRALQKTGFQIVRQESTLSCLTEFVSSQSPRHNPVNAFTMGGIARDAGLTTEQFKKLL
jgi:hypothetical protein